MAGTATLNVRMDADTKRDFSIFCDELGMSASSLMNVFAKRWFETKPYRFRSPRRR